MMSLIKLRQFMLIHVVLSIAWAPRPKEQKRRKNNKTHSRFGGLSCQEGGGTQCDGWMDGGNIK